MNEQPQRFERSVAKTWPSCAFRYSELKQLVDDFEKERYPDEAHSVVTITAARGESSSVRVHIRSEKNKEVT